MKGAFREGSDGVRGLNDISAQSGRHLGISLSGSYYNVRAYFVND